MLSFIASCMHDRDRIFYRRHEHCGKKSKLNNKYSMSIFFDRADLISMTRMLDTLAVSVTLFWLDIVIVMNKLFTRYYSTGVAVQIIYIKNTSTTRRIIYYHSCPIYLYMEHTLVNVLFFLLISVFPNN